MKKLKLWHVACLLLSMIGGVLYPTLNVFADNVNGFDVNQTYDDNDIAPWYSDMSNPPNHVKLSIYSDKDKLIAAIKQLLGEDANSGKVGFVDVRQYDDHVDGPTSGHPLYSSDYTEDFVSEDDQYIYFNYEDWSNAYDTDKDKALEVFEKLDDVWNYRECHTINSPWRAANEFNVTKAISNYYSSYSDLSNFIANENPDAGMFIDEVNAKFNSGVTRLTTYEATSGLNFVSWDDLFYKVSASAINSSTGGPTSALMQQMFGDLNQLDIAGFGYNGDNIYTYVTDFYTRMLNTANSTPVNNPSTTQPSNPQPGTPQPGTPTTTASSTSEYTPKDASVVGWYANKIPRPTANTERIEPNANGDPYLGIPASETDKIKSVILGGSLSQLEESNIDTTGFEKVSYDNMFGRLFAAHLMLIQDGPMGYSNSANADSFVYRAPKDDAETLELYETLKVSVQATLSASANRFVDHEGNASDFDTDTHMQVLLDEALKKFGATDDIATTNQPISMLGFLGYEELGMGVAAAGFDMQTAYNNGVTKAKSFAGSTDEHNNYLDAWAAVETVLMEYVHYAGDYLVYLNSMGAPADVTDELNEYDLKILAQFSYAMENGYDKLYPILNSAWVHTDSNCTHSLQEYWDAANITSDTVMSSGSPALDDDNTFTRVLDESNPVGLFYVINVENGIASIDKESIWDSNTMVDFESESAVTNYIDELYGVNDGVNKSIGELEWSTAEQRWVAAGTPNLAFPNQAIGADPDGKAVSAAAVSMSSYITTGMKYSATYIPMKTNLYSPDTLAMYDKDFRQEFYYRYGFMRKALMWDKSGSSVMDFYNANNKLTNTLSIVTLRDLIESDGNDIALFVDDDFYNADEAIEEATTALDLRNYTNTALEIDLQDYISSVEMIAELKNKGGDDFKITDVFFGSTASAIISAVIHQFTADQELDAEIASNADLADYLSTNYNFDVTSMSEGDLKKFVNNLQNANNYSSNRVVNDQVLKNGDFSLYDNKTEAYLKLCAEANYRVCSEEQPINDDNMDTLVLPSSIITSYMEAQSSYQNRIEKKDDGIVIVNTYTAYDQYTPMLSLAYVSALYRDGDLYSLANLVTADNPVFLASDDMTGVADAGQWYRNTLLNYIFVQNLKGASQIDYTYVVDLDCPLYIDVFGNILTESGIVVIPAACNATLHTAGFKDANVALGLYAIYGTNYRVPMSLDGASSVLFPFFALDKQEECYIINGNSVSVGGDQVNYGSLAPYEISTQNAVMSAYESFIKEDKYTNLNWVAMVNICNEVMRGAPIENIDKDAEQIHGDIARNKAGIVAAVKLESLINSFEGFMSNTLLSIPDFTRMDHTEVLIAWLYKLLIIATTAVIIIAVYRDGVSGELGLRTLWKSLSSVALTFCAVAVIPAVFQLTYYAANKFLLQDEVMRILMLNLEKQQSGVEIGMLETYTPDNKNDMAIQLDWINIPWYDQVENMLYGSTLQNLDTVKKRAYLQSEVYDNYDVTLYNDGVYVSTDDLFSSVNIDYTFNNVQADLSESSDAYDAANGLYLRADNGLQTAGFYSPYYVFLKVLVGNVNQYNYYHNTYNYTTKYVSGNRLKTVGLCNTYFTSKSFMELDGDIMHIYELYDDPRVDTYDHGFFFSALDREKFDMSLWQNDNIDDLDKRVEIMTNYARDYIAKNKDMLTKVTDETFIKVMALNMAIKYNQVFGIWSANAVEIYNMDSNDLLRLSVVKPEDAILASPMSYARYIYNFGGEAGVYAAAILTVIMWVGSFIKPLCTVIVFISVFLSIWVFRVVLRKPSANLLGYAITVGLLCLTNLLHAVILKISVHLPDMGLSTLGCLIFMIFGQVVYLLILGYVTGVSLKDWSNLGYTEYEKEAQRVARRFGRNKNADTLNGNVKHHDDNWDYYNDLVDQHRTRNA